MLRMLQAAACVVLAAASVVAQTTQGTIAGVVTDRLSGLPIPGVAISWEKAGSPETGRTFSGPQGLYSLPLLSPGTYRLTAQHAGYQSQSIAAQELSVASQLTLHFALRPSYDVWGTATNRFAYSGKERLLRFFAADVQTLRSALVDPLDSVPAYLNTTQSYVIDSDLLQQLPLRGRDAYALLVVLPGVTTDNATARGLGFSVNGQRPSSSNFLLDGLENNNELITGSLTTVAPEALEEYRISTSNFSAEYGHTSGFVANAITRMGGSAWHGLGYVYFGNDVLNANGFRHPPLAGMVLARRPFKQIQPGFHAGGPVFRQSLFASLAVEYLRLRTDQDPVPLNLPSAAFVASTPPASAARRLLQSLPPLAAPAGSAHALVTMSPPSSLNRLLVVPRADYLFRHGADRLMLRASLSNVDRPDFIWTPYRDFVSPLTQNPFSAALALVDTFGVLTNELRAGWGRDELRFERGMPDVPSLFSFDSDQPGSLLKTLMPGSPLPYGYRNRNTTWQLIDNLTWTRVRHQPKIGGGALWRRMDGALSFIQNGQYGFLSLADFAAGRAFQALLPLARASLPALALPDYDRRYRYFQYYAFAQDSFRVTPRLAFNYGVRYENYGTPVNPGPNYDLLVRLPPGASLRDRLPGAVYQRATSGGQRLYDPDNNNVAVRAGFAWSIGAGEKPLVLRGSYGVFYDRPFDNLWQNLANNNFALGSTLIDSRLPIDYLAPVSQVLHSIARLPAQDGFPRVSLFQPGFRDAYVHSYFLAVERPLSGALTLGAAFNGSLGRKLITTDQVNRNFSLTLGQAPAASRTLRLNDGLPPIDYRANQGLSDYNALTLQGGYRARFGQLRLSYTWSHAIDNQTEALGADFFNLGFTNPVQPASGSVAPAQFIRQFDSRSDRGSSDFDQRHNLVFHSVWDLPPAFASSGAGRWLRNWKVSELAAIRSGFPYSVNVPFAAPRPGDPIQVNRASLVLAGSAAYTDQPADGGRRLLNPAAFQVPAGGLPGNTGRNAFRGPGLFSLDLSLGRTFALPAFGDGGRLTLRADAFNLFNHANLNNPNAIFSPAATQFGVALFGRKGSASGLPGAIPLDETPRQIQLSLRVDF